MKQYQLHGTHWHNNGDIVPIPLLGQRLGNAVHHPQTAYKEKVNEES